MSITRGIGRFLSRLPPAYSAAVPLEASTLVRAWLVTARPEFMVAIAIIVLGIPTLYYLPHQTASLYYWLHVGEGFVVWCLAILTLSSINCLGDYEIDRLDISGKAIFSQAIELVGSARLWAINLTLIVLNSVFVLILALVQNQPALMIVWAVGLATGIAYSIEPWRLKRRGILNTLAVITGCFAVPMLFTSLLLSTELPGELVGIIATFSLQMSALSFADQICDHEEDRSNGIGTPCVIFGRNTTAAFAVLTYFSTSIILVILLHASGLTPTPLAISLAVTGLSILPLCAVLHDLYRVLRICREFEDKAAQDRKSVTSLLKRSIRTPWWIALSGISICLILGLRILLRF